MKRPHGWVGEIPLGRGSFAKALCGERIDSVRAVPMWDLTPVGARIEWPTGVCSRCAKTPIPKSKTRQFVYVIYQQEEKRNGKESSARE